MIRILQAHDHRDLAVALGAQDIGELVDAREDMAVARDEIAPDRKEAERLLLRGGAAEADRVMDGGDAARPEVRGLLFTQRLGVIFRAEVDLDRREHINHELGSAPGRERVWKNV